MDEVTKAIWRKFRVKGGDTLPIRGWKGTRIQLAELFGELGFKKGAEIGVQTGLNAEVLCKSIPGLELICIDPWKAFGRRITDEINEQYFQECKERLSPYNIVYLRMTSMEAVSSIRDNSLDFVYIDGMHEFDAVMSDLIFYVPKVKVGGIVAGHDFSKAYQYGVIDAVKAYTYAHNIFEWYITRENEPSFFWVKK